LTVHGDGPSLAAAYMGSLTESHHSASYCDTVVVRLSTKVVRMIRSAHNFSAVSLENQKKLAVSCPI